jgi:hypothetical protein
VKREAANQMRELYPSLLERPRVLLAAAEGELHNAAFLREGIIRLRAMAREAGLGATVPDAKELVQAAETATRSMSYSELRPDRFETTAKAAVARMADSKDPKTRLADYETYLLNRALKRTAAEARAQIETDVRVLQRYTTDAGRAALGKATEQIRDATNQVIGVSQPFLEKVDELLAAFELKPSATLKDVRGREQQAAALQAWVEDRWKMGDLVVIPPKVLESLARTTHWKDLTAEETQGLRQAVESLAQQAKNRVLYRVGEQTVNVETVVIPELLADAAKNGANIKPIGLGGKHLQSNWEAIKGRGREALYSVKRVEMLLDQLGPSWKKYVWEKISDASYRFYDLVRDAATPVRKILHDLPAAERARLQETFTVDGAVYDGETVVAVLMNAANESNLSKMIRGNSDPRLKEYNVRPWNGRGTMEEILTHATAADVVLAQKMIDAHESFWSAAEAMEKQEHGIAPPKVQGKSIKFKGKDGVELEGPSGYYPVIYSSRFKVGEQQQEADIGGIIGGAGLYDRAYDAASTSQGYLQGRIESYARPVDLSLDALPRKLVMSAKDIAFRVDAKQVYRLLTDERIRGALHQAVGEEGYKLLLHHLKDAVNDVMIPDAGAGFWLRGINRMRSEVAHSIFGLNVSQTMQNLADVVGVKEVMPQRYFMAASLQLARGLTFDTATLQWKSPLLDQARAESGHMRLLADHGALATEMRDVFRRSGISLKWEHVKDAMMVPFETTNAIVESSAYWGAKQHALDQGMAPAAAVRHAEEAVRTLFGGKRTVDLTAIQRDKIMRHFVMFWGWGGAQLNIFLRSAAKSGAEWSEGRKMKALGTLGGTLALLWAKQLASELFVGHGPDKDKETGQVGPEDWAKFVAWQGAMAVPTKFPVVGSMIRAAQGQQSRDVSITPWMNIVNGLAKAGQATLKAANAAQLTDDQEINLFMAWMEAGGQMVGAPVAQTRQTIQYWRKATGNEGLPEDIFGTGYGPQKRSGKLGNTIFSE